jgi:hypothetical protein
MSEAIQIMVGILFLIAVYILTRFGVIWRIKRASFYIIQDLERQGAFDVASAAELPYDKPNYFRIGMRDYRPKALQSLLQSGIVLRTEGGKYYLSEKARGYKPEGL